MTKKATKRPSRKAKSHGMNWIRKERRLAIYLRDGLACCWCGATIEDGARLTLDHIVPYANGGSNRSEGLVTACLRCNSSRGRRPIDGPNGFAVAVAGYLNHGIRPADILAHIRATVARDVDVAEAKALIDRRGGFVAACRKDRS
jgi:hypothetical protein